MPLSQADRRFLQAVTRLKIYLLLIAVAVFFFLLLSPPSNIQLGTTVLGLALCGVFWLTSRLLSLITRLDLELVRAVQTLKHTLPQDDPKGLRS